MAERKLLWRKRWKKLYKAGVTMVQLREKHMEFDELVNLAKN